MALDIVLEQFYCIYDALHKHNLRAVKPHAPPGNAWWTPQLAVERSRVRAMRRRLQRARDHDLRDAFRVQYVRAFACYQRNIRHAKDTFDRSLCQELTTRNLFGEPFKLAFAKLSPPTHLPPLLQSDGNLTSSVLSSAALLLRVHVGVDDPAEDSDFHRRVRCVVDAPYTCTADDFSFTLTEVEHAVFLGNPRAAPGLDGLAAMFIRNFFSLKPQFFLRIFNAALTLGHFPSQATRIIIIPKLDRPPDQPSAYRPIVINSLFGKNLERLLNSRLYYFLCSRNLIQPRQF
ncbi:hypothetical protein HPB49_008190 [Dermacentor silvarum]|uniref:Uncharacterized protein n=1 Tax=Dermacentor silvarum TaxID=543639 RepID=A0ACB8CE12_DERSI|nr:hypothetical protein HPB49_008190 [Dermacentor silvarum]